MARTIDKKRKSEGDLPTKKKKHVKIIRGEDDLREERLERYSGSEDDNLFIRDATKLANEHVKPVKKTRMSEPARTKVDEYAEDHGRLETQQFLNLVTYEANKKKQLTKQDNEYVQRFLAQVHHQEKDLKNQVAVLTAASIKQDAQFLVAFKSAYAASRPRNGPKAFASLYERWQSMHVKAHHLIDDFEETNRETLAVDVEKVIDDTWEEENDMITKILAVGYQAGLEKFEALLIGSEGPEIDPDNVKILEEIYPDNGEGKLALGWGLLAKKQIRAAKKMVKATLLDIDV